MQNKNPFRDFDFSCLDAIPDEDLLLMIQANKKKFPRWNVNSPLKKGEKNYLLHACSCFHKLKCVRWLLENGADSRKISENGSTALTFFAQTHQDYPSELHLQGLRLFKEFGVDFNQPGYNDSKPLEVLLRYTNDRSIDFEILSFYIKHTSFENNDVFWSVVYNIYNFTPKVVDLLIQQPGFDLNFSEKEIINGQEYKVDTFFHVVSVLAYNNEFKKVEPTLDYVMQKGLLKVDERFFHRSYDANHNETIKFVTMSELACINANLPFLKWVKKNFPQDWQESSTADLAIYCARSSFNKGFKLVLKRNDFDWSLREELLEQATNENMLAMLKEAYSQHLYLQFDEKIPVTTMRPKRHKV